MNSVFKLSRHAQNRIQSRKISRIKVAQAIFYGQIFSSSKGLYKAKLWENNGKFVDLYTVVFSKQESKVVTVEHTVMRNTKYNDEYMSKHMENKIFKRRKRAVKEADDYAWWKEEYENNNLPFTA